MLLFALANLSITDRDDGDPRGRHLDALNDLATALAVSPTDPCILPIKVISYRYHIDITFIGRVP